MLTLFRQLAATVLAAGLGYLLRRWGSAPEKLFFVLNRINTLALLPIYLFLKVSDARVIDLSSCFPALFCGGLVLALLFLGLFFLKAKGAAFAQMPVPLQCALRGSSTLYTTALALPLFSEEFQGHAALSASLFSTFCNLLFVALFALCCKKGADAKGAAKNALKDPVLLAVLLGLFFALGELSIPQAVFAPLESLSSLCTPLSFFLMGVTAASGKTSKRLGLALGLSGFKLLVLPALGLLGGLALGLDRQSLALCTAMLAAPSAASGFALAKHMDADAALAGHCAMLGALIAPFTAGALVFLVSIA